MLIIDKQRDMNIIQKMGGGITLIKKIFFIQGMMINGIGIIVGLIMGLTICWLQINFGLLKLEGGIVEYYPIIIKWKDILLTFFTVVIISIIGSWFPVNILIKKFINLNKK
jgi:lipoprotein-releasing system permease protein